MNTTDIPVGSDPRNGASRQSGARVRQPRPASAGQTGAQSSTGEKASARATLPVPKPGTVPRKRPPEGDKSETDVKSSSGMKPSNAAKSDTGARPVVNAKPASGVKSTANVKSTTNARPAAGAKPDARVRATAGVKPDARVKATTDVKPDVRVKATADVKPDTRVKATAGAKSTATSNAEADVKSAAIAKSAAGAKSADEVKLLDSSESATDTKLLTAGKPADGAEAAASAAQPGARASKHSMNIKVTPSTSVRRPANAAHSAARAGAQRTEGKSTASRADARRTGQPRPNAKSAQAQARPNGKSAKAQPRGKHAARHPRTLAAQRRKRRAVAPKWATPLLVVCAVALVGLGCVSAGAVSNYISYRNICATLGQNTFYDGVTLEGDSLSGMTLFDAIEKYTRQQGDLASSTQITVTAMGNTYTLDSGSVQMSSDLQATLNQAYSVGRSGSFEERYAQLQQLSTNGMDFSLRRDWNEGILRDKIEEIASDVYVQGKNATVESFDPDSGEFTFSSEVTGYELDEEDLYSQITQAIANGNVTAHIEAKVDVVEPEYDVAYMEAHFGRIAMQRTNTTSNSNRNNNIKLATACFDGMRVEPGETVSFNDTTGERSPEKGYKPAGAYSGGVLIEEPGGGVCQVSTTLYNAVVKAGLEVVERSPHSRPVTYIPIGLDAAVNYGTQDMKFKNNTDFPIFISAEYYDRTLTFKIYGHQMPDGMYIMLEGKKTGTISAPSGITERKDSTLPAGTYDDEPARDGSRAVSYKVYYDANNNEISREKLDDSTYPASGIIRRVGTG